MLLNKIINRLESEAKSYAKGALEKPSRKDEFEYGTHHGYLKALSHVEQWIREILDEEDHDKDS